MEVIVASQHILWHEKFLNVIIIIIRNLNVAWILKSFHCQGQSKDCRSSGRGGGKLVLLLSQFNLDWIFKMTLEFEIPQLRNCFNANHVMCYIAVPDIR